MKLTIEPTSKLVELETRSGATMPARVWEGTTEDGTEVHLFVTRVAVPKAAPLAEHQRFEGALQVVKEPSSAVRAYDLRYFVD